MAIFSEVIQLVDQVSPAAKKAQSSVDVLQRSLDSVNKQLIKQQALGNNDAIAKLTSQAEKLTPALQSAQTSLVSTGGSGAGLADAFAEASAATGGLIDVLAAVGAAAAGIGALIVAGAAFAISANEAKGKAVALFDALGEGKTSGTAVVGMLDQLGDSIGQTRANLEPLAKGFETLGITGIEQLKGLTLAAASAGALAEGGGEAFTKLFAKVNAAAETGSKLKLPFAALEKQLKATGLNISDLAPRMNMTAEQLQAGLKAGTVDAQKFGDALTDAATSKGAGPLAKAGASLGNVWSKFLENLNKMFEDIDVGPFLEQVKSLFDIFGQAQPSGQALKSGIGGFFKEVFADATKVVPMIKHFLLDMVIYGLKAYIALKPIAEQIYAFGAAIAESGALQPILDGLVDVLEVMGGAIAIIVVAGVGLAAALLGIQIAIVAAGLAVIGFVVDTVGALGQWIASAGEAASNFVAGLVGGISAGASAVIGAVKGLADGATKGFKDALGIASPSKVMMELGGHTGTGFAMGLDDTTPDVHGAASGVASAAVDGASPAKASASTPAGNSSSNVYNIMINGADKGIMELSREALQSAFEAASLGAGA